jgi:hypothetical protein
MCSTPLGACFFSFKQYVANFATHTAIDRECNFDLLNLLLKVVPKMFIESVISIANVKHEKETMMAELRVVCEEWLKNGKCTEEFIKPLDIAALVKDQILKC